MRTSRGIPARVWLALVVIAVLAAGLLVLPGEAGAVAGSQAASVSAQGAARTPVPSKKRTPTPIPTATPTPGGESVTYQVSVAHDGAASGEGLAPVLVEKWRIPLPGAASYPLIAGGKVFVTVVNPSGYGTQLYALNVTNGQTAWGPIDIAGTYYWSAAAYDAGSLFVINYNGVLRKLDAATGTQRWSQQLPGQYAFTSPPTAANGVVYVGGAGSGGTLYAVNELTGALKWTAPVANGDHSSPALSADGVFVSYVCSQVYKFDRVTGALDWHYGTGCSGGGGKTPVYYGGRLYTRDFSGDLVLDATNGSVVGSFSSAAAPAFAGDRMLVLQPSPRALVGTDLRTGQSWTFTGDGSLTSAPIVVGQTVYVGSSQGNLYGVDAASGQQVWIAKVGAAIAGPDEQNVSRPLTGLGAGNGYLVVPAEGALVAYSGG